MEKRKGSASFVNMRMVVLPTGTIIARCCDCPSLSYGGTCKELGEKVAYVVSGPVSERCPLPIFDQDQEDADEH